MDLVWLVYAISLLTPIGTLFTMVSILCTCALVGLMIYRAAECDQRSYYNEKNNAEQTKKAEWAMARVKGVLTLLIPCLIVLTFLPTPKTAYMMVGAYAAQKVAENGKVQETGGKVLELINQKLDQYIDEGIEEAKDKASKAVEKELKKKRKD